MLRIALVLGLLVMIGPFAIDMYLPAMPDIAADFGVDEPAVQMTLTAYFLALGVAQLVYGPLSDQTGRRLPVFLGLGVFFIGSMGATLAGSVEALTGWRAVQGLGGAAMMVMPRAIVRDLHTGNEATRLMAMVMLVMSVSPMLAPLAGSFVISLGSWRTVFAVLAGAALIAAMVMGVTLGETLPPEKRTPVRVKSLMQNAGILFRDRGFMGLTMIGGFGMASFFVFIASAPFVYVQEFGLTPTQFSLAFAVNAIGFFSASQMAAPLGERLGMRPLVRFGVTGFTFCVLLLLLIVASGFQNLPVVIAGLFCANACLGVVIPTTMVLALDAHGERAGLASSLGGTLQMLAGGLMIAATGPFFDGTVLPMLAAIAICGVMAMGFALFTVPRRVRA
ncbi:MULTISPECIES: multidrug effflux MFS transporter [Roseobacteraceae]|uniref:Bcr/CflA family efflux transporter n=1 Tax=Pseudosulfitobacter pseudonitzschiae TaxID=1402135 RepID=A0A221JYN0_9RHOB|nr:MULTISPECIES: multidrug effflux MFS transporter [Roseobacteraceae]ASM71838.1 bicyclomycin resistance protein [Pseudosulfitobacter pseudonitzschiae]